MVIETRAPATGEPPYTTDEPGAAASETRFNVGLVLDFGELHHLLLSAGHAFGKEAAQGYLAYRLTLGPGEEQHPVAALRERAGY